MVEPLFLTSAVLMGLFLLAVAVGVTRLGSRHGYSLATAGAGTGSVAGEHGATESEADIPGSLRLWGALAVLVVLIGVGGAIATGSVALTTELLVWAAIAILFGLPVVGFTLWGTYQMARSHGAGSALAVGVSLWVFGSLLLLVITVRLVI